MAHRLHCQFLLFQAEILIVTDELLVELSEGGARFIRVKQERVLLREILWCDKDEHYTQIHTERRGVLRFRVPFGELNGLLAPYPQFLTCYKGCIVNAERVERIDALAFLMDNGASVPFAQREKKTLEGLYSSYLFQREREDALL